MYKHKRACTKRLKYKGETKSVVEWAEEYKMKYETLRGRIHRGQSAEEALNTPVRKDNRVTKW